MYMPAPQMSFAPSARGPVQMAAPQSGRMYMSAPQAPLSMTQTYQTPSYQPVVQERFIEQPVMMQERFIEEPAVIDVNIEGPTVSGGIEALGLQPTQTTALEPTFVQPVNDR